MSKFKVAFSLDLTQIAPEVGLSQKGESLEEIQEVIASMFLVQTRKAARDKLHEIRCDTSLDSDVKIIQMSEQIRKMMFTLMAEANMSVERLDESVEISTELPFEKADGAFSVAA